MLPVFLDTCVLLKSYLCDTLLSIAEAGVYRPLSCSTRSTCPPPTSSAPYGAILPLPDICVAPLQFRADRQAAERARAADI